MNNTFELNIDKIITKLAGNPLGKRIFQEQIKSEINYSEDIVIIIPDRIDSIASSFIQGFFEEIVKNIGIAGIEEKITIQSSIPNLKQLIIQNLI
ncbi:STAS-like domain-containing protein [Exiguobacterium acetylicum]